ncbi:putative bifunctional diguanylate cyclase/phosphodiesterase [Gorillibacterium sp. sgz5001074]|uniref:putative bifunctional diguanylate cyclase/phosphodiesterase n=1 Tax=Gorillibacterium sp. sgz5001074 TaxID=3446695 RepID=UPI003F668B7F
MSFKNGKVFSVGHVLLPGILAALYIHSNRDTILLTISGIALLWSLMLIWLSASGKPYFSLAGRATPVLFSLVDFMLLGAAFTLPVWDGPVSPTWLILPLVSLYAFELGMRRSLLFSLLCLADLLLFGVFQQTKSFWSLESWLNLLGIIFCISFIGPTADRLNRMAFYDLLTGLPNRRMFTEKLQGSLSDLHRQSNMLAVMFLDLDGFKYINDTMGHMLGDQLLQGITSRMRSILPKHVMLARMGGDEFALFIPKMKTTDEAAELAEQLLKQFIPSFSLGLHEVYVTASIGISIAPDNGYDGDTLMRNADAAMYLAKDHGRNNYQFYAAPSRNDGMERIKMETMLRHALDRDEFVVYYQPRVDTSTGRLECVEALVRWIHPERGMISPVDFIPLAEETGLIVPIGERVLRKVCAQRQRWTDQGVPFFKVSVNLSARQFRQTELPEIIQNALRSTGMTADLLELELTESAAMQDVNYAILMLKVLKEMGMTIAIDDFGTGYSSLSYLKRFPLDVLKIDKSFISGIHADTDDDAIVRAIIAMGHSLKLKITAEGVETSEQLHYLEEQGCDEIQGYLVGKPMAADILEQWIRITYTEPDGISTPA